MKMARFRSTGFTLLEVLIAVAVVALLLSLFVQLLSGTIATINASNKQIDSASLARITLDRFGNDFSTAILHNGATALYYSEPGPSGNSAISFLTESRARGASGTSSAWTTDTRSAFVGYRVRQVQQNVSGTSTPYLPSLNRGDGRFTFSFKDTSSPPIPTYDLWSTFGTGSKRIPNDLTVDPTIGNDQQILNWQIIAGSIFRFHITFVLDDGRVVQTPPAYNNFFCNQGMGTSGCVPIAFSAENSADPAKRYVKGLVIGVAALDETTRDLAYQADNSFWSTIGMKIQRPVNDGETPVNIWSTNLNTLTSSRPADPNYLFPPARQNLRFYQRFYSANL